MARSGYSSETDTYQSPTEDPGIDREENETDSGMHESATKANDMNIHASFPRPQHPDGSNADGYINR